MQAVRCQGATARSQQPAASLSSATTTAPWMPNAGSTAGTYVLPAHVHPEGLQSRLAKPGKLVSCRSVRFGRGLRDVQTLNPLSNRGLGRSWPWERRQIAQSCAGDSQRDRSFDGLPANLIRSPSSKKEQPLEVSTVVPFRPISSTHPNNIPSHMPALRFAAADTEGGPSIPSHRSH